MKKLSEIGTPYWEFYERGSEGKFSFIKLTLEERRELVRRVWVSSRNELAAEHANLGRALTFEEFLDKEGI
jgi:hypothetical protein